MNRFLPSQTRSVFLILLIISLWPARVKANIKFVDFSRIDPQKQQLTLQQRLLEYLPLYDHWVPDWVYQMPKDSVVATLRSGLIQYRQLHGDPYETNLLLGELSHYLYNLNFQEYYDSAESFYKKSDLPK